MGMGTCRCIPRAEAIATGAEVPPEPVKHKLFGRGMMKGDVCLEQLMALGFREEQLLKALEHMDGNMEQAIDLLGGSAQWLKAHHHHHHTATPAATPTATQSDVWVRTTPQQPGPFLPASTKQKEGLLARKNTVMLECCVVS